MPITPTKFYERLLEVETYLLLSGWKVLRAKDDGHNDVWFYETSGGVNFQYLPDAYQIEISRIEGR